MAAKRTYQFQILAKIDEANRSVNQFATTTQEQLNKINFRTGLSAVKDTFDLAKGAWGQVAEFYSRAIDEALQAEKAQRQLNNAMRLSGEFTQYASQRAIEYADSLAAVTEYSDDQVLSALSLAKNYGLVNKESRDLVAAATDLAAITGGDLNNATQTLAATYNGTLSRELKKMIPELQALTDAQLRNGEAVSIISARLKGSAADALRSYGGDLVRARKDVNEFYEYIGGYALRATSALIRSTYALGRDLKALGKTIVDDTLNQKGEDALYGSAEENRKKAIEESRRAREEDIKEYQQTLAARARRTREAAAVEAKERLEAFRSSFASQRLQLELASLSDIERVNKDFLEKEATVRKAFSLKLIKTKAEEGELLTGLETQRLKRIAELQEVEYQKQKARTARFASDSANAIGDAFRKGEDITGNDGIAIGAGIVANMTKGIEGARALVGGLAGAVADYFIPGLGPVVNEITQAFSKGPEFVKSMLKDFNQALPDLIDNILKSIPAFIEQLIDDTPKLLERIIQGMPSVIQAFIKGIPNIIVGIIRAIPTLIRTLVVELVKAMPEIIKAFANGMVEAAKQFAQVLIDEISNLGGLLGGSSKEGGGTPLGDVGSFFGNAIGSVGDFLGFANGGRTPDNPRLSGDRGLVRIGPDEQTFSKDLTNRMEKYLDANEGGGAETPVVLQLTMNDRVFAEASYRVRRKGFRV